MDANGTADHVEPSKAEETPLPDVSSSIMTHIMLEPPSPPPPEQPPEQTPHLVVFSGGTAFNSIAGYMCKQFPRGKHNDLACLPFCSAPAELQAASAGSRRCTQSHNHFLTHSLLTHPLLTQVLPSHRSTATVLVPLLGRCAGHANGTVALKPVPACTAAPCTPAQPIRQTSRHPHTICPTSCLTLFS